VKLFTQNPFGYQIGYQQPHQAFDKKEQESYQTDFSDKHDYFFFG